MYAVIESGGQQFKVAAGETLKVDKLQGEVGTEVMLDKVLMVKSDEDVKIGMPYLEGAKVVAEIVDQGRDKKVIVFKFKRRKGYKKMKGHRQHITTIKISKIEL